jgi:hypothetical protein
MRNLTNRRILQFYKWLKENKRDFVESFYDEFERDEEEMTSQKLYNQRKDREHT